MKSVRGFTLIELIIVMVIVGILLTIGVPTLESTLKRNRVVSATNELVSALNVARSEAIKLGQKVTLCKSTDGSSCNTTSGWEDGWIIFSDANGNRALGGSDSLLRVMNSLGDDKLVITGKDENDVAINDLTYTSRGLPKKANGELRSGIFSVCIYDKGNNVIESRAVVLSPAGRVRTTDSSTIISCPATP